MAVKKKSRKVFRIMLKRGKLAAILVGVSAAASAEDALETYLSDNADRLIPGNMGKLSCGHASISLHYYAEAV